MIVVEVGMRIEDGRVGSNEERSDVTFNVI